MDVDNGAVLDLPYDGPNGSIFGSNPYERTARDLVQPLL